MSGQCLTSIRTVSGQCLKGVWKVFETEVFVHTFFAKLSPSGQCLDSAWTVSRQCVDSFWKVLDPPAGKVKTNPGNKSNYVKTVSGQCLNSIRTVSERCLESIWNWSFWTHIFCHAQSSWTEVSFIPIWPSQPSLDNSLNTIRTATVASAYCVRTRISSA